MKTVYCVIPGKKVTTILWAGKNGNMKLAENGSHIIQTFHFDNSQVGAVLLSGTYSYTDANNCLSCPFSASNNAGNAGKCYTHKFHSRMAQKSVIKSAFQKGITLNEFLEKTQNVKYVRFGAYGEPVLMELALIKKLADGRKFTGYTHTWRTVEPAYMNFFMASVHSEQEYLQAKNMGYRSYWADDVTTKELLPKTVIYCPNFTKKIPCSECGLCNGAGKARSIFHPIH